MLEVEYGNLPSQDTRMSNGRSRSYSRHSWLLRWVIMALCLGWRQSGGGRPKPKMRLPNARKMYRRLEISLRALAQLRCNNIRGAIKKKLVCGMGTRAGREVGRC